MADGTVTPSASSSPSLTPMQQLAARLERQREAPSNNGQGADSTPSSPTAGPQNLPPSTNLPINSDGGQVSDPSSPTNNTSNWLSGNQAASSVSLAYLAPALKRARKLGLQACMELDTFLASSSSIEREGHQYALTLACHDKLMSIAGHLDYRVPATLNVTVKDHSWAFMLSPTITSYRYPKTPTTILDAMRSLNIADIPAKRETGRCAQVEKVIRHQITQCRHLIKDKVCNTFKTRPKDAIDIASLTAAITSSTKVQPTAALYMRIALIRWVAKVWPETRLRTNDADKNFWLKVDEQLREQVEEFKTPSKIQEACQAIFEADKLEYGQPDLMSHPLTAAHLQDDWLMTLNDKSTTLPQSATQGKKRARDDSDDELE